LAYEVRIAPAANRSIRKLSHAAQTAVFAKLDELSEQPRPPGCERVQELPKKYRVYRVSVGTSETWYRIVYQVKDKETWILVVKVGDRKEVYERIGALKRLLG
jgi:mRNA interferase RelE/StbE